MKVDELRRYFERSQSCFWCRERRNVCNEGDLNNVKTLIFHNLYEKVMDAIEFLSKESESLLHKVSNNKAESFNSSICHALGSKRIFFSQKSSYETRVTVKAVHFNTNEATTELYKTMNKTVLLF